MTQVLRPSVETTSTSVGLAVLPSGSSFPYGPQQSSSLYWPDTLSSSFGSVSGQIQGATDNRYYTYKAIATDATPNGQGVKTVVYSGFEQKTESWATGAMTIQFAYNAPGRLISGGNNTTPTLQIEYSTDSGTTWNEAFKILWDVSVVDGATTWLSPTEHLGSNVIKKTDQYANNKYVNSGIQIPVDVPTSGTTGLWVRFSVGGSYVEPQGYLPGTASYNSPYYIGVGFQLVDIYLTDPTKVAPVPGTVITTQEVQKVLKSGPGSTAARDNNIQFAQIIPADGLGPWYPSYIPAPNTDWYTIPGTSWVSPSTSSTQNPMIVSKNLGLGTLYAAWATPSVGSNWISPDDLGGPNIKKCRFETTFTLPTVTDAQIVMQLMVAGTSNMYLNGSLVVGGSQTTPNQGGAPTEITISGGFNTGINLLAFDITNTVGLIGLDYSASLTYQGLSTPTLIKSGVGIIGTPDTNATYTILSGTPTSANVGFASASYLARYTFTLPGGFTLPFLSLSFLGDNVITDVLLNSISIAGAGQTDNGNDSNTHYYTESDIRTITVSSPTVVEGENTLDFVVKNYSNAVGLDFLGTLKYSIPTLNFTGTNGPITTADYDTVILAVGGTQPYTYSTVADSQTTLPASAYSIPSSTNILRVNGTGVPAGLYTVHIQVTDAEGRVDDQIVTVNILDNSKFNIINEPVVTGSTTLPYTGTISLVQYGGSGYVTWTVQPDTTTLPNATISGSTLTYTLSQYGSYQVGLLATDSLGKATSKVIAVSLTSNKAYKLVDGQIEMVYSDSSNIPTGYHNFNFSLFCSRGVTTTRAYNLLLNPASSPITAKSYAVNKYWSKTDSTSYAIPIVGSVSGVVLEDSGSVTLSNGLAVSTDSSNNTVVVSGTPTVFTNSIAYAKIPVKRGATPIGTISRNYVVIPYNGTTSGNLGNNIVQTVPVVMGQFFTLNPQKPFFNSPDNSRDITWTARVQTGSALPIGISLDKNTGLLYGPVVSTTIPTASVVEFVDANGVVRGTFAIKFDIVSNEFTLDGTGLTIGQLKNEYSGTILSSSGDALTSATVYSGALPAGLILGVSGNTVTLTGTPTESGYFDFWIKATDAQGKSAYLYKRLEVTFLTPLQIVTSNLPEVSSSAYSVQLQAVGGVGAYTWTTVSTLPTSITLSPSGLLSGTTSTPTSTYNLDILVTDVSGATSRSTLTLRVVKELFITTTSPIPSGTIARPYSFQLSGRGGTESGYTWYLTSGSLPGGFNSFPSSGLISGIATSLYTGSITVELRDSGPVPVGGWPRITLSLTISPSTASLGLDLSGVGAVQRGCTYQGVMRVTGTGQAPFSWSASNLPSGLGFTPNSVDSGVTCYISGTSVERFTNQAVNVTISDVAGATVTKQAILSSVPSVNIVTTSLPQGRVGTSYSATLEGSGCNTPLVWTGSGFPSGLILNSNGTITGTPLSGSATNVTVTATDSIGDTASRTLNLVVASSILMITTTSIPTIPSGQSYSQQLIATGGVPPYRWTAASSIPTSMEVSSDGYFRTTSISGTTDTFNKSVVFRVEDSAYAPGSTVGTWDTKQLNVAVAAAVPLLTLTSGIDRAHGTSTYNLGTIGLYPGDIESVNPRPNDSFYVYGMMKDVVASQLTVRVITNGGTGAYRNLIGTVASVGPTGLVQIKLSFSGSASTYRATAAQTNTVDITLQNTANGVKSNGVFTFETVDTGVISLYQAGAAALPTFNA